MITPVPEPEPAAPNVSVEVAPSALGAAAPPAAEPAGPGSWDALASRQENSLLAAAPAAEQERITAVQVTSSREVEVPEIFSRNYTLYALEATTAGAPVRSERRFSDIHTFHTRWIEPLQSLDRPVPLPSDKDPAAFLQKNDVGVVHARSASITQWANAALEMSARLGWGRLDAALQLFLRGTVPLAEQLPPESARFPPTVWDPAGEWCFHIQITFGGETFAVPHRLQLLSDGAHFRAEGHPQGGGCVCRGTGTCEAARARPQSHRHTSPLLNAVPCAGESIEDSTAVRVSMALEVHAPPASPTADAPSPAPLTSQELELVLRKGFRPLAQSFDDVEFGKNAYSALPRPSPPLVEISK
eukprot:COSAG04_NODE_3999_length_2370_cov_2.198591_2_plen_358_part_00